jgi:hypothetical protein
MTTRDALGRMDSDTDATPDTDDPGPDTDQDTSELAREVIKELDTGTVVDDKIVVSRRGLTALIGAGLGAGALATLGIDKASAQQAAGQVGTSSSPVDVEAATIIENGQDVVSSPDDDYEIQKDGTDGQGIINFKTQ